MSITMTGFFGIVLGFMLGFQIGTYYPDEEATSNVICHYLDGKVHGDLCIKDGKVISTK